MLSAVLGTAITGILMNLWGATPMMEIPWYYHFFIGSALFAIVFMATDPVTAASTNRGKWIYGFMIGFIAIVVRVLNPAYPEGWMLAIIFMNTFAPMIDHYIIQNHINKRLKRA
jgi:Na+-transporting NADH:ubiquinone oxidoreductase subunit B